MHSERPDLVVGLNPAHVRELLKKYKNIEVLSAANFFSRLSLLPFLDDQKLRSDDLAPLIIAQDILSKTKKYKLNLAKNFAFLYSEMLLENNSISSLRDKIYSSVALHNISEVLLSIDEQMREKALVNKARALYLARQIISKNQILPPFFKSGQVIILHFLISLSSLQIALIIDLSKLGQKFKIILPADFQGRSINDGPDFLAKKLKNIFGIELIFENIAGFSPLKPLLENFLLSNSQVSLSSENFSIFMADQIEQEAQNIAQKIALIKIKDPKASIALALRSNDNKAQIFIRALKQHNIETRARFGEALLESSAGLLLKTIFRARLSDLASKDLIGLINHPMFALKFENIVDLAWLNRILRSIGVDNSVKFYSRGDRYSEKLDRYRRFLGEDSQEYLHVENLRKYFANIQEFLLLLSDEDSFLGYLNSLRQIINSGMNKDIDNLSFIALESAVDNLIQSLAHDLTEPPKISLRDFISLITAYLGSKNIYGQTSTSLDAVEIILLPKMLGLKFDHVFIADLTFGSIPKNPALDPLINDEQRLELNLPAFLDDPFDTVLVPPKQALEPFWFASTIASARQSINISCARHDLGGQEQASSLFFTWLNKNIICTLMNQENNQNIKYCSKEYQRFVDGKLCSQVLDVTPKDLRHKALYERNLAFKNNESSEYAFEYNTKQVALSFAGRIGESAFKALTPTFIEAFASCRFKGFYKKILQLDETDTESDDMHMRGLGEIAHKVLEKFFAEKFAWLKKYELENRIQLILRDASSNYMQKNYIKNDEVFLAQTKWLKISLVKLIIDMADSEYEFSSLPKREIALGVGNTKFAPVAIEAHGRRYFLGGIIDRIDDSNQYYIGLDYKLSSVANLKIATGNNSLLKTHFQMPVYLKLISKHFAEGDFHKVSFCFASIRDGKVLKPCSSENNKILFEQIFDDQHEQSMAKRIDEIFLPFLRGEILATKQEGCAFCDLSYVCRKDEGC